MTVYMQITIHGTVGDLGYTVSWCCSCYLLLLDCVVWCCYCYLALRVVVDPHHESVVGIPWRSRYCFRCIASVEAVAEASAVSGGWSWKTVCTCMLGAYIDDVFVDVK